MRSEDSSEPAQWIRRARQDLEAAQFLHAEGKAPAVVAVQVQQAVEKALKGLLLARGRAVPRTHDLELLLNEALGIAPTLAQFDALCESATSFYAFERYPTPLGSVVSADGAAVLLAEIEAMVG